MTNQEEALAARFLKAYASIPSELRDEIVAVLGNEPFSWAAVFVEVSGKTEKSNRLLDLMDQLKILGD